MIDREKVIADLRGFINYPEPLSVIVKKALELLKEQEPVKPFPYHDIYWCGKCGNRVSQRERIMNSHSFLLYRYKYCPDCGRKVMWDD